MEWFEKEYKKRFKEESTLEGIESGPLWDKISTSIPQKKTPYRLYGTWVVFALLGISLSLWLIRDGSSDQKHNALQEQAAEMKEGATVSRDALAELQEQTWSTSSKEDDNIEMTDNGQDSEEEEESVKLYETSSLDNTTDLKDPKAEQIQEVFVENEAAVVEGDPTQREEDTASTTATDLKKEDKAAIVEDNLTQRAEDSVSNNTTDLKKEKGAGVVEDNPVQSEENSVSYTTSDPKKERKSTVLEEKSEETSGSEAQVLEIDTNKNTDKEDMNSISSPSTSSQNPTAGSQKSDLENDGKETSIVDEQRDGVVRQSTNMNEERLNEGIVHVDKTKELSRTFLDVVQVDLLAPSLLKNSIRLDFDKLVTVSNIENAPDRWTLDVMSGMNFFDLEYSDDLNTYPHAQSANDSIGGLQIGNSYSINLEYRLNSNWSIGSGLGYHKYENTLGAIFTKDTMALDKKGIWRRATEIRTINHHNKLSTIAVPLYLSYRQALNHNWTIGASLGASWNLIRSQNGRALGRDNTIIDYSNDKNTQFDNFFGLQLSPHIIYRLGANTSIKFETGLSIQKHNRAQAQELAQRSKIYFLGLGLRYRL